MKLKKKTAMIASFALGTMLFTTMVMAEVTTKSGYEQIKDSLKYTAESCSGKLKSYTIDTSVIIKDNDKTLSSFSGTSKFDSAKAARESKSTSIDYSNKKTENYSYSDSNGYINLNSEQNIYHVIEYSKPQAVTMFRNPFKEKEAGDFERIADAVVGNLKDYVVTETKADGSKELSGSLNEAQIPPLVNAVASFGLKNQFRGYYAARLDMNNDKTAKMASDIFVKDVKGKMLVDKSGLMQSILASGTLYGKDEDGKEHNMSFEILAKLYDVNSTIVSKPDLTGKKVEKSISKNDENEPSPENLTGSYKGDIIIQKDNNLVKIGERIVDIEKADSKTVTGRYHEEYRKGYEEYAAKKKDFKFEAVKGNDKYNLQFNYTNSDGKSGKGDLSMDSYGARIYFFLNEPSSMSMINQQELNRVFD